MRDLLNEIRVQMIPARQMKGLVKPRFDENEMHLSIMERAS